jgi:murein endopeptidase
VFLPLSAMADERQPGCWLAVAAAAVCLAGGAPTRAWAQEPPPPEGETATVSVVASELLWRRSTAFGLPWSGSLFNGVQLPAQGDAWFTWDEVGERSPNRGWRRWGTDYLLRKLLGVARAYRLANPEAPRLCVSDISRPRGGPFGARFGGLGHASHQNGLDVDVCYPRADARERGIASVSQIDLTLAQDLVDRFVAAGAQFVFVGPHTGLSGPPRVVQPLIYHDDHMHVRFPNRRRF